MHDFAPVFWSDAHLGAFPLPLWVVLLLVAVAVWTIILKGFSLWYAARGGQKWWFVILLIVNTLGILEIIYLIWFRPRSFELEERPAGHSSAGV